MGARIAGDLEAYKRKALATATARIDNDHVSLAQLQEWSVFFGGPRTGRWWAYDVGASFWFMILDRYGEASLRKLFAAIGTSRDLGAALKQATGLGYTAAEQLWLSYLRMPPRAPAK
jgi:hypothetical protein